MGDLQTGISIVKQATELDSARRFAEAVPYYQKALQHFQSAHAGLPQNKMIFRTITVNNSKMIT